MKNLEHLKGEIKRLENEKFMCCSFKDMFEVRKKVIQLENKIIEIEEKHRGENSK